MRVELFAGVGSQNRGLVGLVRRYGYSVQGMLGEAARLQHGAPGAEAFQDSNMRRPLR